MIPSVRARPQGVRVGQVNKCVLGCRAYDNRAFLRAWPVLLKLPSLLPASGQLETLSKTEREGTRKGKS
jgi:hypothetical protein